MDELTFSLMFLAFLIGVGILVRQLAQSRPNRFVRVAAEPVLNISELDAEIPEFDEDLDAITLDDDAPEIEIAIPRSTPASGRQVELPFGEAPDDPTDLRRGTRELIVAVHVMHPENELFDAVSVRSALDDAGLNFGAMQIFHHNGVGTTSSTRPVFSVAKAVEPGNFDPGDTSSFVTPGLVFFMRLPGRQDGAVVLELMLACAEQVARRIGAVLLSQHRSELSSALVNELRESVATFERLADESPR